FPGFAATVSARVGNSAARLDALLVPPSGVSRSASLEPVKESNNMQHQSFRELGVSSDIVRTLATRSIHEPFPIQALVLPDALAGVDVLGKAPTGSGKTLAFAVPIVERTVAADPRPSALVLVP